MILVPEAVAFAFMAGLKPLVGLQAAWIMCLVAGLLGDRPAMISGATGAVAVVLPAITQVNLCNDYLVKRELAEPGYLGNQPKCEEPDFATPRRCYNIHSPHSQYSQPAGDRPNPLLAVPV
jgi:hypothetical protein